MRWFGAILTLPLVAGLAVDQGVLSAAPERALDDRAIERDSFEIFNEVNGLLRQWGNAIRPNGFSVTLASVPANTLLYHARTDSEEPSSPEWFAFDAEMSYGIYGGRRNTSVYIRTYRTTATLGPLLYFNGLSAALTFSGTLDSQDLLAPSNSSGDTNVFGDYARAERLCSWASTRGVSGFVRTNAGFELLWCDMKSGGLKLVRNMDVTQWADDMDDHSDRQGSDKDGEHRGGGHRGPPRPPGDRPPFPGPGRGHPPGRGFNLFAQYASWEWLRAASHTYDGQGEARVILHSGWHVTARGIQDVANSGLGPPTRMSSLSNETIAAWRRDVDSMLRMVVHRRSTNSGVDWRGATDLLVSQYSDRIPQLKNLLDRAFTGSIPEASGSPITAYTSPTNTSVHLQNAYRLVSSLILPFFDRNASRDMQIDSCTRSIIPELDYHDEEATVTSYERKLWMAITHVHQSICTVLIDVHSELAALRQTQYFRSTNLKASTSQLQKLIIQLDWSSWVRCPDVCAWGQVCYIPIWPLFGFGAQNQTRWPMPDGDRPEPQCAGSAEDAA